MIDIDDRLNTFLISFYSVNEEGMYLVNRNHVTLCFSGVSEFFASIQNQGTS
jgi:hypothetical protein